MSIISKKKVFLVKAEVAKPTFTDSELLTFQKELVNEQASSSYLSRDMTEINKDLITFGDELLLLENVMSKILELNFIFLSQ